MKAEMKTLLQKEMMVGFKKGNKTKHIIEAIIHEAGAGVKLEILTLNEIKKSTERNVLLPRNNQNRSTRNNTQNNSEKYDQKKRNIFLNGRTTSEKFDAIVIATHVNNRKVRIAKQEDIEVHIFPETRISQNNKDKDVPISTEMNNFFHHS